MCAQDEPNRMRPITGRSASELGAVKSNMKLWVCAHGPRCCSRLAHERWPGQIEHPETKW